MASSRVPIDLNRPEVVLGLVKVQTLLLRVVQLRVISDPEAFDMFIDDALDIIDAMIGRPVTEIEEVPQ